MDLIATTAALAEAMAEARRSAFVTVDTEFMRETTYWAKLCLVQVACERGVYLIDPLAPGISLDPLFALLDDPQITKVFHAARQDIEIFHTLSGRVPQAVVDTQIAGMVCGFGESVSYENLIRETTGHSIDKSSRFTDWSKRPLSDKQLAYAAADVTHLRDAWEILAERLVKDGRIAWIAEEMAALTDPSAYVVEPAEAWRRLKVRTGSKKFLAVLKTLAEWREYEAQGRDVPRGRVLKDDALLDIAGHAPKTTAELDGLRSVPRGFANSRAGQAILEAVARGLALPPSEIPVLERPERREPADSGLVDALKLLLRLKAEETQVAPRLIASASDVEALAADDRANVSALHGWRLELFGQAALDLKHGKVILKVEDGKLAVRPA